MNRRQFALHLGAMACGASLPAYARAQSKTARIGILGHSLQVRTLFWKPLFAALSERGWREGIEYALEVREALGDSTRILEQAKELVDRRVDVLLAIGGAAGLAAREATHSVPIVTWCGYPVEAGLAQSLARPGGNVTGVASYASVAYWGKLVELLRELRPELQTLGVLWDYSPPGFPDGHVPLPEIEQAARRLGIDNRVWMVRTESDLTRALSEIERDPVQALLATHGGVHLRPESRKRITSRIEAQRIPAITDLAYFKDAPLGCVLAYSPSVTDIQTRLASLVDRVLRGANPAELPFELPARFDLAVYLKAAKAIGLTVPPSILLRADRVIE